MAASAGTVTTSSLSGMFYEVYADKVINLVPDSAKAVSKIPFELSDKGLGNKYNQPFVVSEEQGFTYAPAAAGGFDINTPVAMSTVNAQVDGYQILLASRMDYETAAKAMNSKRAFAKATEFQVKNMVESAKKRLECELWYGQTGLGKTSSSANSTSTKTVVTLTAASWAPLIWAGKKNAKIEFHLAADNTLVSSGADAIFTLFSVDVANKKITVTGTSTGISALDTAIAAGTHDIYWYTQVTGSAGSFAYQGMAGIDKIVTNTGTLFGVDAATYDLAQGNSYSVGNTALSLGKVLKGISLAVGRGLDEDVTLWCNPDTWTNLAVDEAALRRYGAEVNADRGPNGQGGSIRFHHMNGTIEITGHGMIKGGEAFALPMKRLRRIGAYDVGFTVPGMPDKEMFIHLQSNAAYEYRLYTHQALFIDTPAKCVKFTNIVNA